MRACRVSILAVLLVAPPASADVPTPLEQGYRLMYGLDFASAEQVFRTWRTEHPRDPLGPMSEAANLLFAELDRSGVLKAQFFVNDASFTSKKPSAAPAGLRKRFDDTLADAERLAVSRVRADARDRDAIFALATVYGLRADYAALVEGRGMASLSYQVLVPRRR